MATSAAARVQTVVAGAGVVGLACARALAASGREVLVLEAEPHVGSGVSSRNSGVIHAGMYYPRGSLKGRACVDGRRRLYRFCEAHGVPHARVGKLVVATHASQLPALDALREKAEACGVTGDDERLRPLDAAGVAALEPEVRCVGGVLSPSTGIVDAHELMLALQGEAEASGATVACAGAVERAEALPGGGVAIEAGGMALHAAELVNCAGLDAPRLVSGLRPGAVVAHHFAKGNYFSLAGRSPFGRLVYPLPDAQTAGLGVHATVDLAGRCRFGPDVEWLDGPALDASAFTVDASRAESFYAAVRTYWPGLADGALAPDYAGVRPKLSARGEAAADFLLQRSGDHGCRGLVQLLGIESPGLTASLALADLVVDALDADAAAR